MKTKGVMTYELRSIESNFSSVLVGNNGNEREWMRSACVKGLLCVLINAKMFGDVDLIYNTHTHTHTHTHTYINM